MSIRQTKSGEYFVDVTWPDKMRTRRFMPDEKTANHINSKITVAIVDEERIWRKLRKSLFLDENQITSFSDLADRYLAEYVQAYNRDIRVKKSRLEVLKERFNGKSADCINLQEIGRFIAAKKKDGAKNATINRYIALLKHMVTWAIGQGIFESNPITSLEKMNEPEWIGARPDESTIDGILGRVDSRVVPIFWFMRETGCRREEAISLTLPQIDFSRQEVIFHTNTKSGRSRKVPLTEKGLWAVQALPSACKTVFYHPEYLKPWTGDGLALYWEKARGDSKLRMHDLRHAYAIKLAEDGCQMHFISEVMGHHSIEFTRRRYARFSPESASRAVLRVLQGRKDASGNIRQK